VIAFTVVNLTVLLYFAVHLKKRKTPREIFGTCSGGQYT
jgi:putrescine importer